jgi:hypothetical protein
LLRDVISQQGTGNWSNIASHLLERTGKQCRERWHNHLNPGIKKGDWTEEEDRIILKMQKTIGNQWAKITKYLPGRTDNAVKNRYHATVRAKSRGGGISSDDGTTTPPTPMTNDSEGATPTDAQRFAFNESVITSLKIAKTEKSIVDVSMRRAEGPSNLDAPYSPKRRGHQRSKSNPLPAMNMDMRTTQSAATTRPSSVKGSIKGKSVTFKRKSSAPDGVYTDVRNISPTSVSGTLSYNGLASASDDAFNRGIEVIAEPVICGPSANPIMDFTRLEPISFSIDEDYLDTWLDMDDGSMPKHERDNDGCLEGLMNNCELDPCCPMALSWDADGSNGAIKGQEKAPQCDFIPRMWKGQQGAQPAGHGPLAKRADQTNGFGTNMFSYEGQDESTSFDDSIDHSYAQDGTSMPTVYSSAHTINARAHSSLGRGAPTASL